ncbi:glycerol dehydratase reactivase beta/small subunit family protein [Mycobacterium sp. BMJ-28]
MRDGGQPVPPAISVISCGADRIVNEVLAGIEEEGVPALLEQRRGDDDAHVLARAAALGSSLGVGVGIDAQGRVSVQHEKLAGATTGLFSGPAAAAGTARTLGHNAARIVVGVPLRAVAP